MITPDQALEIIDKLDNRGYITANDFAELRVFIKSNAELARLGIILRERLRYANGMIADGRGIAALIEAIHYFDAEYARQFPRRAALDGPAANNP